jgi:hypothetical protein
MRPRAALSLFLPLLSVLATAPPQQHRVVVAARRSADAVLMRDALPAGDPCTAGEAGTEQQRKSVIVSTDIGHDSDDFVFLLLALALHKAGLLRIEAIVAVSGNNASRAKFVAWQCRAFGLADEIPVVAAARERGFSRRSGAPLDACVEIWRYGLDAGAQKYVRSEDAPDQPVPTLRAEGFVAEAVERAFARSGGQRVTLFVIGPGAHADWYVRR